MSLVDSVSFCELLTEVLKFQVMQRALPTTVFDPFNISVRK